MNKLTQFSVLITAIFLTCSGCTNPADVEAIAARVTVLEGKVSTLEIDIAAAKAAATDASAKAAAAEVAANRAAEMAEETNSKVSKIFKQNCEGC